MGNIKSLYDLNPNVVFYDYDEGNRLLMSSGQNQFVITTDMYRYICKITNTIPQGFSCETSTDNKGNEFDNYDIIQYLLSRNIIIDRTATISKHDTPEKTEEHLIDYLARLTHKKTIVSKEVSKKIGDFFSCLFISYIPFAVMLLTVILSIITTYCSVSWLGLITNPEKTIYYFSLYLPLMIIVDILVSPIHEFGHLGAARSRFLEVGEVGIGIYMTSLAFYSNLKAVNMADRVSKIIVDIGGLVAQSIVTIAFCSIGLLTRNVACIVVSLSLISSLLYNLNPFSKTDGYWLLSDFFRIPNLHIRMEERIKKILKERRIEVDDKQDKYVILYVTFFVVFFIIMVVSTIILLPRYVRQYPQIIAKYILEIRTATIENNITGMLLGLYLIISAFIPIVGAVLLLYKGIRFLVFRRIRK